MPVICALETPLYMAIQSVLGGKGAPEAGDFDVFVYTLESIGLVEAEVTADGYVLLKAAAAAVAAADKPDEVERVLKVKRPHTGYWYRYENSHVSEWLEEHFGVTDASFIEVAEDILDGEEGFMIPAY